MLSENQTTLIRQSFAKVVPVSDVVARMFYDRLFEIRPDFRKLFPGEMADQRSKLVATLAAVVQSLDQLEEIVPAVQALGQRHVGYGASTADYAPVGEALLWTLEQGLGDAWTPDMQEAWAAAYAVLADVMIAAADEVAAQ